MENIAISIIGSCVSRDTFGLTKERHCEGDNDKYVVERFIQNVNPLSAISEPLDKETVGQLLEKAGKSKCSPFFLRMFEKDLKKTCLEYLSEKNRIV